MRTQLPASYKIDYGKYFDAYLEQPDALREIPSEAELMELAHKAITRERLTLLPLSREEQAAAGDTATIKASSDIPRYNKEKVTATLGRGLYNKELEEALIGHRAGDTVSINLQDQPVTATILELRRKQIPEPTDEMVQELQARTADGRPINTVKEYEDFIRQEKVMTVLATINFYVASKILEDLPQIACDKEDIKALGDLERDYFIKFYLETEKTDIRENLPEQWKQNGIQTLDDFIAARGEWYEIKIKQCLMFLNILDLPCQGQTDPLDHYEVLQELQMRIFDLIRAELERRKRK